MLLCYMTFLVSLSWTQYFELTRTTKVTFNWILFLDKLWENIKKNWKMFQISPNGPLIRGVIKEFIFSKIAWSPKSPIRVSFRAATTASRVDDFGLQTILENMNSLITPLISGPFRDISNISKFWYFLKVCQDKI